MDFGCDRIQCINLIERTDKRKLMEKLGTDLGIEIDFFPAIRDKECGARGCFMSHVQLLADAYDAGVERLLVFEDDVEIGPDGIDMKAVKRIRRFLDNNNTWEIFNMGGIPDIWNYTMEPTKGYPDIYRGAFMCTHVLIVNRRGMKKYKDIVYGSPYTSIDLGVYRENEHSYTAMPHMLYQSPIENDIGNNSTFFLYLRRYASFFVMWYSVNVNIKAKFLVGLLALIITVYIGRRIYRNRKKNVHGGIDTSLVDIISEIAAVDTNAKAVDTNAKAVDTALNTINQTL